MKWRDSAVGWFGLGRPRSKFGKWIEDSGLTQQEVSKRSGVSDATISELARKDDVRPSWRTRKKLRNALRDFDEEFSDEDFWDE